MDFAYRGFSASGCWQTSTWMFATPRAGLRYVGPAIGHVVTDRRIGGWRPEFRLFKKKNIKFFQRELRLLQSFSLEKLMFFFLKKILGVRWDLRTECFPLGCWQTSTWMFATPRAGLRYVGSGDRSRCDRSQNRWWRPEFSFVQEEEH